MNENTFIKHDYREAFAKNHDLKEAVANTQERFFFDDQHKLNDDKN